MNYELHKDDSSLAKGLFYRAMRHLPYSKILWLDGVRLLRGELSIAELNDILTLMTEKELRIRKLPQMEED